jgi:asparagine synthase (glutamine-hydrolysing)
MCGIIGFVDKKKRLSVSEREALMSKMLDEIIYRGRDASGIYENNGVVIGHNRLAILDLSEKSNQPLSTEDGDLVISYNGEIFNHVEMRESVVKYKTDSDTETLLYAYKRHRKKSFESVRGMFAVSFYEPASNKIILSIDRFGIKPLYYLNTEDWFAWSSEPKVFKHLEGFSFLLNEERLSEYGIFRVVAGSETMLKGVCKLTPSEIVEYDTANDSIVQSRYHEHADVGKGNLEELLIQSVSEHVLSDVPIGFQLSGGVDSSLISALAKNVLKQKDIHSFSIGLDNPKWNEFEYSREVAKLLGTKHHEMVFDQDYFCKNYPIATYHLDEPIVYPNTVPIMLLSNIASNYVKVLLSGEGADELFGGYNRYRDFLSKNDKRAMVYSNSFSTEVDLHRFFKIDKTKIERRELIVAGISGRSVVQKLGAYDLQTFLPSLLLRQDKMGMASTVENRFPFLDFRLVDFALGLPDLQKISDSESKVILKNIASKYLPSNIVFRKKCGFGLPISEWLRDSEGLGKYLQFFTNPKVKREYLNYHNINKCIDEHLKHEKDNSEIIWILLSLELWARIFIDGEDPNEIWPSLENQPVLKVISLL